MFLPIKSTQSLLIAFSLMLSFQLMAQDTTCSLSPPTDVTTSGTVNNYSISWTPVNGAQAYEVVVIDMVSGDLQFSELTHAPMISIVDVSFTADSYIGIASMCDHGELGSYGYFPYESNYTINVQDIVMQMEGEPGSRTLECDAEKVQVQSISFTGGISTNVNIAPPFNASSTHPVKGSIIEVSLYNTSTNNIYAQATMLGLSNNTVHNAADQINVTSTGTIYKFVSPAGQNFFDYSSPAGGQFDYFVNTVVPNGATYQLLVEQRNCFNVNKIRKRNDNSGLKSTTTSDTPAGQWKQQEADDLDFYLYPNPAVEQIQFTHSLENVVVRNNFGQVVHQADFIQTSQTLRINNWSDGVYYLDAATANGDRKVIRFIKS